MKETLDRVVIRFAGDSGDGMQLTGTQFTTTTALQGNDIATFPDFPAEIRAPAGTVGGVSGFQLHFSSNEIKTPGDAPSVLVAMNAAALKKNLRDLNPGAMIIVNTDRFREVDLRNADYEQSPLEDDSLSEYNVIPVKLSSMTEASVKPQGLNKKEADRCKNFFALGITYWLFNRDKTPTINWIKGKFKEPYATANLNAMEAGWSFAETMELLPSSYEVPPAKLKAGVYRNISGNQALALGFVSAASLAQRPLFLGAYPITPASDLLHNLSKYKEHNVLTFQAEDEIAAISATIGAAFGGNIAITSSSGPGIALKGEAIGLATITELPLVIVDVQRGGPSTGLPTKTEQSDLNIALYGRHGESPIPVLAAQSPSDCFYAGIEAVRMAVKYRMPIMLLTDGYIANGSEPWRLPEMEELKPIDCNFATNPDGFLPYNRDEQTLARPWAIPGTPGMEHRIGGLEKENGTGNVSYDPDNHALMSDIREKKVKRLVADIPNIEVHGDSDGVLCVSWGGTFGSVRTAVDTARAQGVRCGHVHLRWLNPLPANLGEVLSGAQSVLIMELNLGQLYRYLRAEYLVNAKPVNKIQGQPFKVHELVQSIKNESLSN